jgi:hypothetical protein
MGAKTLQEMDDKYGRITPSKPKNFKKKKVSKLIQIIPSFTFERKSVMIGDTIFEIFI